MHEKHAMLDDRNTKRPLNDGMRSYEIRMGSVLVLSSFFSESGRLYHVPVRKCEQMV